MELRVKERILALKFLEKQNKNPALAKQLGIEVKMKDKRKDDEQICSNRFGNV